MSDEADGSLLCKARVDHLKSYASGEQTEGMKNAWRQTRIDRMLVDHFLRAGYYTAAQRLSESSGIEVKSKCLVCLFVFLFVCLSVWYLTTVCLPVWLP